MRAWPALLLGHACQEHNVAAPSSGRGAGHPNGAAAGARHAGAGLVQQQRVRVADERDGQAQLAPAAAAVRLRRPGRHLLRAATLP
jgi:hypothetical protein